MVRSCHLCAGAGSPQFQLLISMWMLMHQVRVCDFWKVCVCVFWGSCALGYKAMFNEVKFNPQVLIPHRESLAMEGSGLITRGMGVFWLHTFPAVAPVKHYQPVEGNLILQTGAICLWWQYSHALEFHLCVAHLEFQREPHSSSVCGSALWPWMMQVAACAKHQVISGGAVYFP